MRPFVVVFLLVALVAAVVGFETVAPFSYALLGLAVAAYAWAASILLVEHMREHRGTIDHTAR